MTVCAEKLNVIIILNLFAQLLIFLPYLLIVLQLYECGNADIKYMTLLTSLLFLLLFIVKYMCTYYYVMKCVSTPV